MHETPYVSVLIPAKNEAGNLIPLLEEVRTALANENFEVIVVDDGSTDATAAELRTLQGSGYQQLRVLSHTRSLGQSTSIYHAAEVARGHWLATLDGDGQNDPADLPKMLDLVRGSEGTPRASSWWQGIASTAGTRRASVGPRDLPTNCAPACSRTRRPTPVAASS